MNLSLRLANYLARYAPSYKKVQTYLLRKKCQNIDEILKEAHYDEDLMCSMWMRTFLSTGKWEKEIRQKLYKKEFPKELIETKIAQSLVETRDWKNCEKAVQHQIQTLIQRGKSKALIRMTLVQKYPYFRDEIGGCIDVLDDDSSIQREFEKYKNKYDICVPAEKQKLLSALLRKGFSYDDIKKLFLQ